MNGSVFRVDWAVSLGRVASPHTMACQNFCHSPCDCDLVEKMERGVFKLILMSY